MAFEFRLPDIGEGVVEGEIVSWKVKAGDVLALDQPMVEVMTDKATVEIPSPRAGRVLSIDVAEGAICQVGQVMLRIETDGGAAVAEAPAAAGGHAAAAAAAAVGSNGSAHAAAAVVTAAPAGARGKALAAPATRKLARDLGIDLALVPATGDAGRVTPADVRAYAAGGAPAHAATQQAPAATQHAPAAPQQTWAPVSVAREAADERIPFRGVRKKIAENMSRSKHSAAHFTYVEEGDFTDLVALRARARKRAEERGVKLSFLPFIIKAVVAGLKKYPIVNATLDEAAGEIVLRKRYHIGIATASDTGLIVPVIKDADRKSLFAIARELDELATKVKAGKASREELTGSTFTISSLGQIGGVLATPIINFPEVAVLGVHKIKPAPAVRDGQIVIRELGNLSISLDHRIVDGYEGALFLQHVIELLSDPTLLVLELV